MKKRITALTLMGSLLFGGNAMASSTYTVESGDTLWQIATNHNISVDELITLNDLNGTVIYAGQTLLISQAGEAPPSSSGTYTVQSGDTLYAIASLFDTTVSHLLELNPSITNANLMQVGQVLNVPGGNGGNDNGGDSPAPSENGVIMYTVQSGDTFYRIAYKNGMTQDMLRAFNPSVTNPNNLSAGQSIQIPTQELIDLSKIIHLEARGEPMAGQVAVANVVQNRVADSQFPNTIHSVLHQDNQFTPVRNGSFATAIPNQNPIEAAKRALGGENGVPEALFFFNPTTSNSEFMRSREVVTDIGNHRFVK
ncbi:LysM peptidoglycan-binding domain-containing protein [Bacillus sp. H-16]|uniref:LysM peptidoglycan-binding domain-containing protein n=1 Tax=Alteribacter salitolerans TaxID=2912333 RepID=UPI001962F794|nr:LysM peptidoglycan-binding domain-containing protein [Alteribacter salitolerans]MBM7096231.1 LysM peptidoglycan-binding domain-containing protein [Alteribacter salitolerans]